jgi:CheY-like chemotaxis protein
MEDQPEEKLTLLLAEDDFAIRDIIITMCELWDFNVLSFKDGHRVSEYLADENPSAPLPDVAILDIRMPGPWGHELGAKIRQHPRLHNMGIILMTAYELAGNDESEYVKHAGADRLLYKPLPDMDELLAVLQDVLTARRTNGNGHSSK